MPTNRREFIKTSLAAAAALAAGTGAKPTPPSDRLRLAVVGVRGWGASHVSFWSDMADVEVVALCDVDERVVARPMKEVEDKTGKRPAYVKDIRKLLEDQSLDAVSIATPNHWHVLAALWAVEAGKDVYVEKPASHSLWEGRQLVAAAHKHGRLVQVGTQSRSKTGLREAMAYLHSGELGELSYATAFVYRKRDSIGTKADAPVPEGVDYNLWLGPAPKRAFNPNRFHYQWHWQWDYGNGEIGNIGAHYMDLARWGLGKQEHPLAVLSLGGRLGVQDDGQTANTQIALMDWGDRQLVFEARGLPSKGLRARTMGVVFHCAGGSMVVSVSDALAYDNKGELIKRFTGGADEDHFRNFVEAVKTRNRGSLNAEVLEGHLSASLSHLGNASYRLGKDQLIETDQPFGEHAGANEAYRRLGEHLEQNGLDPKQTPLRMGRALFFDAETESLPGDDKANGLLRRSYRKPFVVTEQA